MAALLAGAWLAVSALSASMPPSKAASEAEDAEEASSAAGGSEESTCERG